MTSILEIENLEVNFRGFHAVDGFDMAVSEGELRVLIGANGAGKTTLMDLITGRTKSTSGKVTFLGDNITNWQEHKIARRGIGRKFQVPSIFKDLTVRENLEVAHTRQPVGLAQPDGERETAPEESTDRACHGAGEPDRGERHPCREPVARAGAVAGAQHGAGAESQAHPARRADRGDDRSRNRGRPPRSSTASGASIPSSWSSTT